MSAAAGAAALIASKASSIVPSTATVVGTVLSATNLNLTAIGPVTGQAAGDIGLGAWFRTNTTNPGLNAANTHFTGSPTGGPGSNRLSYTYNPLANGTEDSGATTNSISRAVWVGVRNSPGYSGILDYSISNGTGTTVTVGVPATPIPPEGVKVVVFCFVASSNLDISGLIGTSGLISLAQDPAGAKYWRVAESSGCVTSFAGGTFAIVSESWSTMTIYIR